MRRQNDGENDTFLFFHGTLAKHLGKRRAHENFSTWSKVQDVHIAKKRTSKMDFGTYFMLITFEIQTFFELNPLLGSYLAYIKKSFNYLSLTWSNNALKKS